MTVCHIKNIHLNTIDVIENNERGSIPRESEEETLFYFFFFVLILTSYTIFEY